MPRRNRNAVKGVRRRKQQHGHNKRKGRQVNDAPMTNFTGHPFRRIR